MTILSEWPFSGLRGGYALSGVGFQGNMGPMPAVVAS
jgi:hypothetical protein